MTLAARVRSFWRVRVRVGVGVRARARARVRVGVGVGVGVVGSCHAAAAVPLPGRWVIPGCGLLGRMGSLTGRTIG